MRQSASSRHESQILFPRARGLLFAATLGLSSVLAPAAWAQEASPEASPPAATPAANQEIESTTLMEASFEDFPPAPMTVRMLRITLEPGASTPMHTHPGPEFDLIESGELTFRSDGEAPITRANGETEMSTGEDVVLSAGDWILFPPEVGMYYINEGDEPVEMLSAVLLPVGAEYPESITYTDGQPSSDAFIGVSFVVLGDGLVQTMPDGPANVAINEVTVPAGADLPESEGVAMYSAIDGEFSFIVDDGMVQVSRSELESLQPNAVAGEEFSLEQGDAAFFPAGVSATSRAGQQEELQLLTLEITFEESMSQEPAEITFSGTEDAAAEVVATEEPVAETEPEDTTDAIIGQVGTANADLVNIRAEPSTDAGVIDQIVFGIEVEVVGGPVEAEGITWYEVEVQVQGGSRGWVSADLIDGIEATDASAQAAPTDAADAQTDTTATEEISPGDTVQLTDDEVRVRTEGNLGGDIVNTYSAGTLFEVTGEPVEADGYTWYPVTLVDDPDTSGWVTADFLEPAP